MNSDQTYPFTDCRYVRNSMILKKIGEKLDNYKSEMEFEDTFTIFIINPNNLRQVIVSFPTSRVSNHHYYGDFILFLTVENYQTLDDILYFFSSNSGPNLQIMEFEDNIPFLFYFRYIEGETRRPARFWYSSYMNEFIKQYTNMPLTECIIYLEHDKPPESVDLNKALLVLKDSNNHIILKKIFQDQSTGWLLTQEDSENQNFNINSIFAYFKKSPTSNKIKKKVCAFLTQTYILINYC